MSDSGEFTLCLIVKDEEDFLEECLKSAAEHATAIVVVDTGSMDRTVEIASTFTNQVIQYPIENDFSQARNRALEHVATPWTVFLDADERFEPSQASKLQRELRLIADDVLAVRLLRFNFFATGGCYDFDVSRLRQNQLAIRRPVPPPDRQL